MGVYLFHPKMPRCNASSLALKYLVHWSVEEAYEIDKKNGNPFLADAMAKE
jgi:hypothetical protein